jgi:hypothetical protein
MQMPRQRVSARHFLRVVAQRQAAPHQRFIHHIDAQMRRRITGAAVVVATHQGDLERRMLFSPRAYRDHRGGSVRLGRVQKVAQEKELFCAVLRNQPAEQIQVFGGGASRHGHAQCAKAHGFADVGIGDKQGRTVGKKGCFFGKQVQRVHHAVADFNGAKSCGQATIKFRAASMNSVGLRLKPLRA